MRLAELGEVSLLEQVTICASVSRPQSVRVSLLVGVALEVTKDIATAFDSHADVAILVHHTLSHVID